MRILIAVALALAAVLTWALRQPRGRWNPFASAGNGTGNGDTSTIPMPSRSPAATSSRNLTSMTRAELYEMAKRLGIPGRSAMSKEQLVRAISARSRT